MDQMQIEHEKDKVARGQDAANANPAIPGNPASSQVAKLMTEHADRNDPDREKVPAAQEPEQVQEQEPEPQPETIEEQREQT
ncbi:hypothetical protein [Caballeronia sp. LZ034LL]|uniref:hypothetical protein n=1 Tax=Caballeronia sp. LZ034LL TaxID=3038567 RepID=UPI00285E0A91|nr:hypothetical protein [Caballeronia sp. LZ034LL]MDR5839361.1 hypothetical protein [Caballeronia sp. LZ034LL]